MADDYETLGYDVVPDKYLLSFEPDMHSFKYKCSEEIEVHAKKEVGQIALNSVGLRIKKVMVSSADGSQHYPEISEDKANERIILRLKKPIHGSAKIHISFEGASGENLSGFYRSRYVVKGKEKHMLTTQFEAANARNAFPCFDQPSHKARFKVTLVVEKGLECISNMPIESEKDIGKGKKAVSFLETPPMCTYLLYLGVGNFEYTEDMLGKVKIRIVTTEGKKEYTKLPLEYAKKFLDFYNNYFGMPYPLPKMDLLAIPDFAAGAMENWGAVTFREVALLADEDSAVNVKQRIAEVIAHEFAHQWFGDLVTMEWWDDLWLNESFATFMSYKAMDSVFPEWEMHMQYINDVMGTALSADQLRSTHPIRAHVKVPSEIDQIFDEISYEKGGAVLNMIEDYVGKETFREGLQYYLNAHSYSNATNYDLWNAIDHSMKKFGRGMSVYKIANEWVDNKGYPIISVEMNKETELTLRQERFLLLYEELQHTATLWPVPIKYITDTLKTGKLLLMDKKGQELKIGKAGWVKFNYGQNGIYRVSYPLEMLNRLGSAIRSGELDGLNAWGIENDMFALVRSGRALFEKYLEFIESYCIDTGYPLNENTITHLGWLYNMLYNYPSVGRVKKVVGAYSRNLIKKLGWIRKGGESNIDTMLRSAAVFNAALAEDKEVIGKAHELFHAYVKGKPEIDQNLRSAIYKIEALGGDRKTFGLIKERYLKETRPDEKVRLLGTLGAFSNPGLAGEALGFCLSKDVRAQDTYIMPTVVASNPVGREVLWEWTRKEWPNISRRYESGTHMIGRFITPLNFISDRKRRDEIETFFKDSRNMRDDMKLDLDKTLERIDINIRFMATNA